MENFWDFSVQHYAKPGVADACLTLQDQHGLDVNLVLLCIWQGRNYGELSARQFDRIIGFSERWADNTVRPLRNNRRWLKRYREEIGIPSERLEGFRGKVKRLELEAEHLQQDQLQQLVMEQICDNGTIGPDTAIRNLEGYLAKMGVEKTEELTACLAAIVQ